MAGAIHKYRLAFDAPLAIPDGQGGSSDVWEERSQTRGDMKFLRGGETVQAARLQGRQPVVATIRNLGKSKDIETSWRMRDLSSEVVYAISAIVPTEDQQYLEVTAESGRKP